MATRFIVLTDGRYMNAAGRNAITLRIKEEGWAFWHYLGDVWLLSGLPDDATTNSVWLLLSPLLTPGRKRMLVMDADDTKKFYGQLPTRSWDWLKGSWRH